ncbi:hypothetical protein [Loigolactobacillus rennini]|uniref:Uncharacterized protein n=1 Tax=Loigolactobacillus rennini DSM 20253 TaxID=1423796 RepID=A0A0R2DDU9_9LACO|nr:hypothetical protein [Loigolactobacillus rennini]KRM99972.1 hypothetical protein FC24_GL001516 [Loigolactobacillus rennini DSM 20253]
MMQKVVMTMIQTIFILAAGLMLLSTAGLKLQQLQPVRVRAKRTLSRREYLQRQRENQR